MVLHLHLLIEVLLFNHRFQSLFRLQIFIIAHLPSLLYQLQSFFSLVLLFAWQLLHFFLQGLFFLQFKLLRPFLLYFCMNFLSFLDLLLNLCNPLNKMMMFLRSKSCCYWLRCAFGWSCIRCCRGLDDALHPLQLLLKFILLTEIEVELQLLLGDGGFADDVGKWLVWLCGRIGTDGISSRPPLMLSLSSTIFWSSRLTAINLWPSLLLILDWKYART